MVCLSVILLCYRITWLWFCNKRFCNKKGGCYLCWTLHIRPTDNGGASGELNTDSSSFTREKQNHQRGFRVIIMTSLVSSLQLDTLMSTLLYGYFQKTSFFSLGNYFLCLLWLTCLEREWYQCLWVWKWGLFRLLIVFLKILFIYF